MIIRKLKLRGAIGIWKGQGREEIEIDFTQFEAGLIALTGRNGSGKTTIMENLHPYRMMVSRDGSLESHFMLKDSYRILEFEHEGTIYESKMLIDAITGESEPYLLSHVNGEIIPLNDGKKKTYDIEIEKLLGTPDLFFNSVFSGQKSKGIAQLKPADRRKLFYELLNLNSYEVLCEKSKEGLKKAQMDLAKVESEIATLQSQNVDFEATETKLTFANREKEEYEAEIERREHFLKRTQEEIQELKINIATLNEKAAQNAQIEQELSKKRSEKIELEDQQYIDLNTAKEAGLYAVASFKKDNPYTVQIEKKNEQIDECSREESQATHKANDDRAVKNKEITRLESDLEDKKKLQARAQRIVDNKATIQAKIEENQKDNAELTIRQEKRNVKVDNLMSLQGHYNKELETINTVKSKQAEVASEISRLGSDNYNIKKQIESLGIAHAAEVARINEESAIIGQVPCKDSKELNSSCQFLSRAFQAQDRLPELIATFNNSLDELAGKELEIIGKLEKKKKEFQGLSDALTAGYNRLEAAYSQPIQTLKDEISDLDKEIAWFRSKIDLFNKENWNKFAEEIQEAESNIQIYQAQIEGLEAQIINNSNQIIQLEARKKEVAQQYEDKRTALKNEIASLQAQYEKELENIKAKHQLLEDELVKRQRADRDRINAEIESLQGKIDNSLQGKITEANKEITQKTINANDYEILLADDKKHLAATEKAIAELQANLEIKAKNEAAIEAKKTDLEARQQEVKEYSFLVKAFDKTGIPVLKLENSGIEITSVANELLSSFENKFRIVFETTRLKADGKSSKETFDINIIEDDGVCEISNKSGGQQVWLETAIQLAISLVVRQQGRNIQTSFLDEKDGALDLDNAMSYIEMLRRAHQMSGVHNTFIITHRPELLDFIPQQVSLKEGVLEVVNG